MKKPEISVIMPVYNAYEYIREAIQSILDQTFPDFEFIIIDDGSSDNSNEIIRSFNDKRISIISHSLNKGNYPSRNEGTHIAKGKYICVMDADDVALNTRLERQYLFMEDNSEIGLAGSGFRYYGKEQDILRESDYGRIKVNLLRNNCYVHPTLIIRHHLLLKHQLFYNDKYFYAADYDLVVRASRFFKVTNINEILLLYRLHENQITSRYRAKQAEYADEISIDQLRHAGIYPDPDEIGIHLSLLKGVPLSFKSAIKLYHWIEKLLKLLDRHYDHELLKSFLEALYSYQSFCWKKSDDDLKIPVRLKKKHKLTEFEILIPVRIDSNHRMENILAVINFINQNFNVPIRILESDSTPSLNFLLGYKNVIYHYDADENLFYNKTVWVNRLISLAEAQYIIVWDADVVVNTDQILESVRAIKTGECSMALPYDGRAVEVNNEMSRLFRKCLSIDFLGKSLPAFDLMHGYHMAGGIYIVEKEFFLSHGGENENMQEWSHEDAEKLKRMEASGLPVYRSTGVLFHLFHPGSPNSRFADKVIEKKSRMELLKTCELCH